MHAPRPVAVADGLHSELDRLAALDARSLSEAEVTAGVRDLYAAEARLAAVKARLVAELDARTAYAGDGAQSAAQWIAHACRLPAGVARHDVLLARSLRHLPATEAHLADGELTVHHASRLAHHQRNPRVTGTLERDETTLIAEAVRLPFALFTKVLGYWAQLADQDGAEVDADAHHRHRRLHLSRTLDGSWRLDGHLDPVAGAAVDTALRAVTDELYATDRAQATQALGRPAIDDDLTRSPAQRRADALVELAHRATAIPPGARRPAPLISILVGYETFAGRICELADGTLITPGQTAALLDTALIERAVFDSPSRVTDISHQRRFTGAVRRAIELRDRTCTHPYCDAPAWRCDHDHIDPHANGGPTTQDNGRLHCPFHNHLRQREPPPDTG